MSDYYTTLGITKDASSDEIKRAYRRLASIHHPDKGGSTERFQEIQAAHDTLIDPQRRAEYDNPRPQPQMHGFHGGFPAGFEEIFAQFGGNPFGDIFGQRGRHQPQRNKTLNIQTTISLEDAFNGKELMANLTLPSGRNQVIEIKVPIGIQSGTTLRLAGIGDDSFPNIPRGDIHLTVHIDRHSTFQRQNDDLLCSADINCIDAILGKTITFNTIDNKVLEVTVPAGTQPGQTLSIQGYGMPNINDNRFRGRLLININIEIPTNLTEHQKSTLANLFS